MERIDQEIQSPEDLRPAPRRTPLAVLVFMATVVMAGTSLLLVAANVSTPTGIAATPGQPTPTPLPGSGTAPDDTAAAGASAQDASAEQATSMTLGLAP